MLKQFFDIKLASYDAFQDIVLEEILQADLLEIRGFVPGGIYHSQSMRWAGNLRGIKEAKEMIRSKKDRKVIEGNKAWFEEQGYRFEIVTMTKALFEEFDKLYQQTTLKAERPQSFSIKEQILGKILVGKDVYLIGMFKNKSLESGLVFSVTDENEASVSFGAKKKFDERRGGVGGVLELLLIEYCLSNQISRISHGKSKNPAGIISKAGVFEFKARYGFSAFPESSWKTTFILSRKIAVSDLVFVTILKNKVGYLIVSDKDKKENLKKFETREITELKQLPFSTVISSAKKFVQKIQEK